MSKLKSKSLFDFFVPRSKVTTASINSQPESSQLCDKDDGASSRPETIAETNHEPQAEGLETNSVISHNLCASVESSASQDSSLVEQLLELEQDCADQSSDESLDLLQECIRQSRTLHDHEKYQLLTSLQEGLTDNDLDTRYYNITGGRKRKQITFQRRWLQDYKWLRYGIKDCQGGWCLPCILFLSGSEKASLGAFVCTPFTNYNKSKELCEGHAKKEYHLRAMDRVYEFKRGWINPTTRIDSQLMDCNAKNFRFNSQVLPLIVEAVLLCAK